jgi:hypothetical protein
MNLRSLVGVWILASAPLAFAAQSTPFDGKTNLTCTVQQLFECDSFAGCRAVAEDVAYPIRHLDVDVGKKSVTIEHIQTSLTSTITSSAVVQDKLVLQGTDSGLKGEPGGGGWSMSINQTYGTMILTTTAQDVAFVGMGACIGKR